MRSRINACKELIDTDSILLYGHYYSLPQPQADGLMADFCNYINNRFSAACVCDWWFNERKTGNVVKQIREKGQKNEYFAAGLSGYVKNNIVYNKKTQREFTRSAVYPAFPKKSSTVDPKELSGYNDYYKTKIQCTLNNPQELKKALLGLFDAKGGTNKEDGIYPDISVYLANQPFKGTNNLSGGTFLFAISAYSIDCAINEFVQDVVQFGKDLVSRYSNVNIEINYNKIPFSLTLPYAVYFGENLYSSGVKEVDKIRNYLPYYYVNGVSWGHFISTKTQLLRKCDCFDCCDNLVSEWCGNNTLFVHPKHTFSESTIYDLKEMKRFLYPLILPRKRSFSLDTSFRQYWEDVPVFEDEISVADGKVCFSHHGSVDPEFVCDILNIDKSML